MLEAAEDAFGGEKGLLGEPWVSPELKLFKSTANSYRAIGVESRHGTLSSGVPTARISLPEARQLDQPTFYADDISPDGRWIPLGPPPLKLDGLLGVRVEPEKRRYAREVFESTH